MAGIPLICFFRLRGWTDFYILIRFPTLNYLSCSPFALASKYTNLAAKVEVRLNKELLLNPITICRTRHELCFIEPSINSVRVSFRMKQEDADPIEEILCRKLLRFLMQRAEDYAVLRRVPVEVGSLLRFFLLSVMNLISFKTFPYSNKTIIGHGIGLFNIISDHQSTSGNLLKEENYQFHNKPNGGC